MFGEDRVDVGTVVLQHAHDPHICRIAHVADDHERVAPDPAEVAVGDVPVAVPGIDLLVVGLEESDGIDPGVGRRVEFEIVSDTALIDKAELAVDGRTSTDSSGIAVNAITTTESGSTVVIVAKLVEGGETILSNTIVLTVS